MRSCNSPSSFPSLYVARVAHHAGGREGNVGYRLSVFPVLSVGNSVCGLLLSSSSTCAAVALIKPGTRLALYDDTKQFHRGADGRRLSEAERHLDARTDCD